MASVEMLMPKMGESIIEGTILTWLKKEGDSIEADESVLEVATDKVDTEVPATQGGILTKILAKEGDVVAVGTAIAIIETNAPVTKEAPVSAVSPKEEVVQAAPALTASLVAAVEPEAATHSDERFYSPLVKSIAKEEGISADELSRIPGSGAEGRVTKQDMLDYLASRSKGNSNQSAPTKTPPSISQPKVAPSLTGGDELIEMDRMRKMIATRMVESKRISAHVTSFVEADMTNIVLWREKNKEDYKAKYGEGITFTPFFIDAVAKAIRDFPMINISVEGDHILKKKDINIGMAVALPSGNLIVPVIKYADQLNIVGISKKVNDLANRARNNKLTADDVTGGTYTVSN
ncbi:MAG: 2-oxo acid dehydrogenase subunit E2, partial [Algoriphagus sp.]|nr:2-oxo acid dehydrogenase subunit E2 [Algoriphagus sp.]